MGDASAHSIFAPSASKRWLTCTASIKLSAKAPPQKDTPESIEGTDAHWVGQSALENRINALSFVGSVMPSGAKCTKTMAIEVDKYVQYVLSNLAANGGSLHVEGRVTMEKIDPRFWGSCDALIITKYRTLHVFDLKYGLYLVEVEDNSQAMSYAIGALTRYKHLIDLTKPVTLHICQPRPKHKNGWARTAKISINDLIEFGNKAKAAIQESDGPNAKLVAGDHCTFCPAEFTCPELNKMGRMVRV